MFASSLMVHASRPPGPVAQSGGPAVSIAQSDRPGDFSAVEWVNRRRWRWCADNVSFRLDRISRCRCRWDAEHREVTARGHHVRSIAMLPGMRGSTASSTTARHKRLKRRLPDFKKELGNKTQCRSNRLSLANSGRPKSRFGPVEGGNPNRVRVTELVGQSWFDIERAWADLRFHDFCYTIQSIP